MCDSLLITNTIKCDTVDLLFLFLFILRGGHDQAVKVLDCGQWRKRNIFRGGGGANSLFLIFPPREMPFPGRSLHFVTPKTKCIGLQKSVEKEKKKSPLLFYTFSILLLLFHSSNVNFHPNLITIVLFFSHFPCLPVHQERHRLFKQGGSRTTSLA